MASYFSFFRSVKRKCDIKRNWHVKRKRKMKDFLISAGGFEGCKDFLYLTTRNFLTTLHLVENLNPPKASIWMHREKIIKIVFIFFISFSSILRENILNNSPLMCDSMVEFSRSEKATKFSHSPILQLSKCSMVVKRKIRAEIHKLLHN